MASYATHAPVSTALGYTALFATGAFIMRGAGCTINDMWDRRLDRAVGAFLRALSHGVSVNIDVCVMNHRENKGKAFSERCDLADAGGRVLGLAADSGVGSFASVELV